MRKTNKRGKKVKSTNERVVPNHLWRFDGGYGTKVYDIPTIKTFIYKVSYDIGYHKYMI